MPPKHAPTRGSALVIVLAAIVLVSALVLSFYVQAGLDRQIAFSSGAQIRADQVARGALDTLAGDLRAEMAAGSTVYTSNNVAVYIPSTNLAVVPARVGDQGSANLLKMSAGGSNSWSGSGYTNAGPVRSAANNSSTNVSANGRRIDPALWNSHYLFGTNVPAGFIAPDWVVVTRSGAITNAASMPAMSVLADPATANPQYAVGRFAFAIFNEGGLLDVNVAGYPTGVGADFTARRGLLPQVDIGKIPGVLDANALVQWRNAASAASPAAYTNSVLSNTNGFTRVAPGDQAFVSRKDLVRYARDHPSQLSLSALQYLGTFSRESNAPSYTPDTNRPRANPPVAGGDDAFNPSLVNLRGTDGQPSIKKRFPLDRLALLTRSATAGTPDAIYRYFGLQRASASSPWTYNHGAADRILRLSEVAAAGREPDFFELLQAAITFGSLGKASGNSAVVDKTVTDIDKNTYYQILQIGANIIDQYDADSFPTRISFNGGEEFSGLENLPYLNRIFGVGYRRYGVSQPANRPNIGVWFQPEIWNPHAQAGTPAGAPDGPTEFRFVATGKVYVRFIAYTYNPLVTPNYNAAPAGDINSSPITDLSGSDGIRFSNNSVFQNPALLAPANGATATGADDVTDDTSPATHFVGIHVGSAIAVDQIIDSTASYRYRGALPVLSSSSLGFMLQYRDGSSWVTYSRMSNIIGPSGIGDPAIAYQKYAPTSNNTHSDPRTDRFGGYLCHATLTGFLPGVSFRPDQTQGFSALQDNNVPVFSGWTYGPQVEAPRYSVYLGALSDNKNSSSTRYTDPDGVQRRGDGAYADGTLADGGYPLASDAFNKANSRPVILNRPFRSVGELAYAARGMPWKSLDLFTAESGDAALLDVFCLHESSDPAVEAGKIDLNTRQQPVLKAVLAGAIKSERDNTTISDTEADTLAASLIDRTTNAASTKGPLLNRSDLVTRWAQDLVYSSAPDTIIKSRREAAIRALADVGQTRTWNLLIDLVAQSGRYPKGATNLDQFVVEGQRHYWLHVALDRYTGKVVARYLEPIYE